MSITFLYPSSRFYSDSHLDLQGLNMHMNEVNLNMNNCGPMIAHKLVEALIADIESAKI